MNDWNDNNRFDQTGYSAPTCFPLQENYVDENAFLEDLEKALKREQIHQDWLEEERMDYSNNKHSSYSNHSALYKSLKERTGL